MTRKFTGDRLVVATHNKGKVEEIGALLAPYVAGFASAGELGLPEPEENGGTFTANAIIKARAAAQGSGHPALADDSGLCVAALGGDPGVDSALWGGAGRDFAKAMALVHEKMGDAADRSAYFICVLALAWPDGHVETVEGRCDGQIVWPPRGTGGHGYDPIFMPTGGALTFAEMNLAQKQGISHRAQAFSALVKAVFLASGD